MDNWWKEDYEENLTYFKSLITFLIILTNIWKLLIGLWIGLRFIFTIQSLAMSFATLITVILLRRASIKYTKISALIWVISMEISNWGLFYVSWTLPNDNKIVIVIESTMLITTQTFFLKHLWVATILMSKHIFMWYGHKYFFHDMKISSPSEIIGVLIILFFHTFTEFSRRKRSFDRYLYRKKLESAEKRLAVLLQAFPDGLIVFNSKFEPQFINDKMMLYIEMNTENALAKISQLRYVNGKKFQNIFSESLYLIDDLKASKSLYYNEELLLGIILVNSINLQFKVKKILWGNEEALLVTAINANKIIELESTSAQNQCKNLIFGSISHEIKDPNSEILKLTEKIFDEHSEELGGLLLEKIVNIRIYSNLLAHFIDDVLDFSYILQGNFELHLKEFNLRKFLSGCCKIYSMIAEKKKISLSLRIDSNLPDVISSDSKRLFQVISNLLNNAFKFTYKGNVELCAIFSADYHLKISVTDTGIGIPEERLLQIKNQILNPGSEFTQATGLGLHISKLIIQKLGGSGFYVSSKIGRGTEFSFKIGIGNYTPGSFIEKNFSEFLESENDLYEEISNTLHMQPAYPKILIADSSDFNREGLACIFKKARFEYIEAINGKQVIKQIILQEDKNEPIYVIIMNTLMPVLDGWETAKRIKRLYQDGMISFMPNIIGVVAEANDDTITKCYSSGMIFYLVKPANPEAVLNTIRHFVSF